MVFPPFYILRSTSYILIGRVRRQCIQPMMRGLAAGFHGAQAFGDNINAPAHAAHFHPDVFHAAADVVQFRFQPRAPRRILPGVFPAGKDQANQRNQHGGSAQYR